MNTILKYSVELEEFSGPEVVDGAKPDVPTTDRQNEKKKKHRPFYEAVDAHARRRLKKKKHPDKGLVVTELSKISNFITGLGKHTCYRFWG